jgi:hypothetical protein
MAHALPFALANVLFDRVRWRVAIPQFQVTMRRCAISLSGADVDSKFGAARFSHGSTIFPISTIEKELMSDSPMTEDQGDSIIQLLKDILWELKNGSIQTDVSSINSDVSNIQSDVSRMQSDVGSIQTDVASSHVIDPRTNGIAPHQPRIVGLQQFGRRNHVPHSRIEPQVIAIWIKNDGHSVVDC